MCGHLSPIPPNYTPASSPTTFPALAEFVGPGARDLSENLKVCSCDWQLLIRY